MPMVIQYLLAGTGLSECTLHSGTAQAKVTATYLSDALGNLAAGTHALLNGEQTVRFTFDQEQGKYRWLLERNGEAISCKIFWLGQLWDDAPDDAGNLVFSTVVPLSEFAHAVRQALAGVLETYGVAGYKEKWVENEFPQNTYQQIAEILAEGG